MRHDRGGWQRERDGKLRVLFLQLRPCPRQRRDAQEHQRVPQVFILLIIAKLSKLCVIISKPRVS